MKANARKTDVVPMGFRVKVKPLKTSGGTTDYVWEVSRYGKVLAHGAEAREADADKAAGVALVAHAKVAGQKHDNRNLARMKLKRLVEYRPYLVAGACERMLAGGAGLVELVNDAEEYEQTWWEMEPVKFRRAIPSHPNALKPGAAAGQLLEVMGTLGLIRADDGVVTETRKLRAWAAKVLGDRVVKS